MSDIVIALLLLGAYSNRYFYTQYCHTVLQANDNLFIVGDPIKIKEMLL
ncbi:hypothetical protein [Niastella populi]|nr:hypothetical protein [Niastella populi]